MKVKLKATIKNKTVTTQMKHFFIFSPLLVFLKYLKSYNIIGDYMINLVEKFMDRLTIDEVNNFAIKKGVHLTESELEFTYNFVKKNWKNVLANPTLLNLDRYSNIYSSSNLQKIKVIFNEYSQKYQRFL